MEETLFDNNDQEFLEENFFFEDQQPLVDTYWEVASHYGKDFLWEISLENKVKFMKEKQELPNIFLLRVCYRLIWSILYGIAFIMGFKISVNNISNKNDLSIIVQAFWCILGSTYYVFCLIKKIYINICENNYKISYGVLHKSYYYSRIIDVLFNIIFTIGGAIIIMSNYSSPPIELQILFSTFFIHNVLLFMLNIVRLIVTQDL